MPDGHASTPSFGPALLKAARELAPLRSLDDGLKSAYRDPREHPLVQGTPRDSEEALAGAVESGAIAAGRAANGRLMRFSFDLRAVGVWLSTHDNLSAPEMVDRFATDHAPLALREEALAAAEAHRAASVHHAGLKRIAAHKLTREAAIKIDKARAAEASAAAWDRRAADALDAWARARITAFLPAWEATSNDRTED